MVNKASKLQIFNVNYFFKVNEAITDKLQFLKQSLASGS